MKITFLGAGAFGQALSKIAQYNGHEIHFYDPIKFPEISLKDSINGADVVVFVAPSSVFSEIAAELEAETPLICASKGFLSLKPFEKFKNFSVLGGAAFADTILEALADSDAEKKDGSATLVTLTASSPLSEQLFSTENIKIEYTEDSLGILLCGALKNVYAIGAGMYVAENLKTPTAVPTPYLSNVITEFRDILEANGAKADTLKMSCGAADLVLSCGPGSRNFNYGYNLKNPDSPKQLDEKTTIEGLSIIRSLNDNSDFILPESAAIFRDIISIVNKE